MTTEEQNRVNELWENSRATCTKCKQEVNPSDCKGCPVYGWSFSPDD